MSQPAAKGTTAKYFDQIVELVRSGMQIKAACQSDPAFPKYTTFQKFISLNPDYRARLDAVRNLDVGEVLVRRHWDEFIGAIEAGGAIVASCEAFGFSSPSAYRFMRANPDRQAQFDAAIVAREAGPNALGQGRVAGPRASWQAADFDAAVEHLASSDAPSIEAALQPPLMPKYSVFAWAKRDAGRMKRLREALAARPRPGRFTDEAFEIALNIVKSNKTSQYAKALQAAGAPPRWAVQKRKQRDEAFRKLFAEATGIRKFKFGMRPKRSYGYAMLQTSLQRNDLYRAARAAVPSKIDPDMREDLISEIVVAVMEGRLQPDEIRTSGYSVAKPFERKNNRLEFVPVDLKYDDDTGDTTSRYDLAGLADWSFEGAV